MPPKLMPVLMLILVCCYLGCHLRRGQGGNAGGRTRGGVTCTSWDTHISSQPIVVAISRSRRQTDGRAQCWYTKVTGSSTHTLGHIQVLPLLGCNRYIKGSPTQKKLCIFGHCPNCDLTPPIAQIRALCGTTFLQKMRKYSKQQF